ncbi:MAG: glyceraldehyde-3-phosphate dehydrogenase [Candidatus Marinimicrobia bacterium]|nr:glyceraldehyde-3-phosphate dehydrogenase [Candidatus Neomarinimicrobiota bacterium]
MSTKGTESHHIRVGLMGFGRIGRNLYRLASETEDVDIVVISDVGRPEILHYLLQHDSIHGTFTHAVRLHDDRLQLEDDRTTQMIMGVAPGDAPWLNYDVDLVVDATGKYPLRTHMEAHLKAGAKRVLLSTLPGDEIDRLVVMGLNEATISPEDRMISAGSSTTAPVALMLDILDQALGIDQALMTTVHAYTSDQPLADLAGKDFRRSRSAAENIIPNASPTPQWIGTILPRFKGKLAGIALNVPVPDGSCVDMTYRFKESGVTVEAVNEAMLSAEVAMPDIVEVTTDPIVSSDVIGNRHSLVFDTRATVKAADRLIKTLSWYDNGWGHAARLLELIQAYARLDREGGMA